MSFLKEIYRYKAHGDVSLTSLSVVCIWDICVVAEVHHPWRMVCHKCIIAFEWMYLTLQPVAIVAPNEPVHPFIEWTDEWMDRMQRSNLWISEKMNWWMADGWMTDGWMHECMDGCMHAWMNGCMDQWMDECMDEWMNGWMNEWMDGWMNEWMDGWMNELDCNTVKTVTRSRPQLATSLASWSCNSQVMWGCCDSLSDGSLNVISQGRQCLQWIQPKPYF